MSWHAERRARILARHPSVRGLHGPYRASQAAIVALVVAQVALAGYAGRCSWPAWLALSFGGGAFLAHALGVLIHEATHNLVARGSLQNKVWLLVANLPLVAPAAVEFRVQHLLHHRHLGDVDGRDTQAPTRREIAWVGNSAWRKLGSFTLGRFFYKARPANHVPVDALLVMNWVVQIAATGVLLWLVGWKGVLFLVLSALLAFGPHPLGARRLSEHLPVRADQPSVSYYGPLNWLSFNVGYHVEHHDFPAVAWTRLPALRREAKGEYDTLFALRSWSGLLVRYFVDPRYRVDLYVGFGRVLPEPDGAGSSHPPEHLHGARG